MNKARKVFIIVIILLVLAVVVYLATQKPKTTEPIGLPETVTVKYLCRNGSVEATYGKTAVDLLLSDGRKMTLPQTISGSGVRYESADVAFITKGSDGFIEEKGVVTYEDCVANASGEDNQGTSSTFTDQAKTFSFSYPKEFIISSGGIGYTSDWRVNTQTLGLVLAKLTIPKTSQPQTNFSEAKLTVGTSSDLKAVKNCLIAQNGEKSEGDVIIGSTKYKKITLSDAGAGNFYDTTSYHTVKNDQCYVIEYTIHSTNIGNYSPDQGIKEFDKQSIENSLESILQSFTFL